MWNPRNIPKKENAPAGNKYIALFKDCFFCPGCHVKLCTHTYLSEFFFSCGLQIHSFCSAFQKKYFASKRNTFFCQRLHILFNIQHICDISTIRTYLQFFEFIPVKHETEFFNTWYKEIHIRKSSSKNLCPVCLSCF